MSKLSSRFSVNMLSKNVQIVVPWQSFTLTTQHGIVKRVKIGVNAPIYRIKLASTIAMVLRYSS